MSKASFSIDRLTKAELLKLTQTKIFSQKDILYARQEACWDQYTALTDAYLAASSEATKILKRHGTGSKYYTAIAKADALHERSQRAILKYERLTERAEASNA